MSEPYSEEPADSEAARRLLECDDDYRNYLDSQSDCASSLSANQIPSHVRRRRPTVSFYVLITCSSSLSNCHLNSRAKHFCLYATHT
jgi:hypothetical protein